MSSPHTSFQLFDNMLFYRDGILIPHELVMERLKSAYNQHSKDVEDGVIIFDFETMKFRPCAPEDIKLVFKWNIRKLMGLPIQYKEKPKPGESANFDVEKFTKLHDEIWKKWKQEKNQRERAARKRRELGIVQPNSACHGSSPIVIRPSIEPRFAHKPHVLRRNCK
ncbi:hypothetical protein CAEBREN_19989 [Caenorhabditis brenneri]|uniref:Uncharacterized protein n=1 Tax=Caenorhabditis brenneri TaxID=135651 RepID=G0MCS6_CAEBE|nr:hypothetical protein CAEBREN_19989 [Caenorhabditis brenneri]